MNMGQLRKIARMSSLPDDAPVLVPTMDHGYRPAVAGHAEVMYHTKERTYSEGAEPEVDEEKIDALVIS